MDASIFPVNRGFATKPTAQTAFDWQAAGLRYFPYNEYLRHLFGSRVQKISLDGGFTCPNVDGTVAVGGCTFCDNRSFSPSRRVRRTDIAQQIERGIEGLRRRYDVEKYLGYFQPATNTYGPLDKLRTLYETALSDPRIVGLVIGTRPDCVPDEVLDLIDEFAEHSYVSLEIGMQTIHDASLDWMNRGHHHDAFLDAMTRMAGRKFHTSLHVMLGLPGETREMMLQTAEEVARWRPAGVKIHNLYAVHRTRLADQIASGEVRLLELDEYLELLADFIERMPPETVIERISGDAPPGSLIAPAWCLNKGSIKSGLLATLERRGTRQAIHATAKIE
ncbi:MAG: TIGR01212 family radical SAM protein [Aureliella sp.]